MTQGVRFHLKDDTLRIDIGPTPLHTYNQRVGRIRLSLIRETDEIAGFSIEHVTDYLSEHPAATEVFGEILPALRVFGVLDMPPQTSGLEKIRVEYLKQEFEKLVPA